jgi:N-acetylglucosamine-6-phosphate deacetylase
VYITPASNPSSFIARHYLSGLPIRVSIADRHYHDIQVLAEDSPSLPWIAPGLIDPQINGFAGVDFNRLPEDKEALRHASTALRAHGCTRFLLTWITHPEEGYVALTNAWQPLRTAVADTCMGYHLEGPFLNPDRGTRGAHPAEAMRLPSLDFLQQRQASTERGIRCLTMAPEMDSTQALLFIQGAVKQGVRIAAGHSLVMGSELATAIRAGLSAWTHLGNAAPVLMHKFDNVILHTLASTLPYVFLIPDGLHLPPPAFRALACALGPRLLLTTDAMAGAAFKGGAATTLGSSPVTLHADGRATLRNSDKLAGSTLTPFAGVFRAAAMSGLPWAECWAAFSTRTAHWLGWEHGLEVGQKADYCLFHLDPEPTLVDTVS